MARFMIVHNADYEKLNSFDRMVEVARSVIGSLDPDVFWLNSWWSAEKEKLFCEWEAPERQILEQALQKVCDYWPVDDIYEVLWSDPRWYESEA